MGMFYNKLMESAVDEVIQTPDDIGVDLDAIEKNIVGDDGCEAHREEIDDAMEGVVGDPLEEAATIMYESEYNFNQLLKCIGMAELNEMAVGRDFVLEAGSENSKSFWEKTKDMFVNMFKAVTRAFKNVLAKISAALPSDKKFVTKNAEAIRNGAANGKWEFKGCYEFNALMLKYQDKATDLGAKFDAAMENPAEWNKDSDNNIAHATLIKNVVPDYVKAEDAGRLSAALKEAFFVEKTFSSENKDHAAYLPGRAIDILQKEDDVKSIRAAYAEIKKGYTALFKHLKEMQGKVDKKAEGAAAANNVCIAYIAAYKYEKNVQNTYFTAVLKAHMTARAQARRMVMAWYRAGAKKNDKKEEPAAKNESSLFNITII